MGDGHLRLLYGYDNCYFGERIFVLAPEEYDSLLPMGLLYGRTPLSVVNLAISSLVLKVAAGVLCEKHLHNLAKKI